MNNMKKQLDYDNPKVQAFIGFVVCQLNLGYSIKEIKKRHPEFGVYVKEVEKQIKKARQEERKKVIDEIIEHGEDVDWDPRAIDGLVEDLKNNRSIQEYEK